VVIEGVIELVKMCRHYGKPASIYIPNAVERLIAIRNQYQLPIFESPEEAARALAVSYEHFRALRKKEAGRISALQN
jgi:acyl-CoA synthetase (NDP forming)